MTRQSYLLEAVFTVVLGTAAAASGGAANVCLSTSQDGLSSCKNVAQANYWNAMGVCANLTDPKARDSCIQNANAASQSALSTCQAQFTSRNQICQNLGPGAYDPAINPANFSTNIDNPYFPLKPGTTFRYAGPTSQGYMNNTVEVTSNTLVIDGVTCVEVHDQVFTDGALTEDTFDYYAQDNQGNVWYFGENSDELVNGRVTSIGGSWKAGVNGAKPGIILEAHPQVGDFYRQEFLLNTAEDSATVLDLNQTVTVPAGTFQHCLETAEVTGLEPGALEHKYYSPGVGNVLTVDLVTGDTFPLVQVTR